MFLELLLLEIGPLGLIFNFFHSLQFSISLSFYFTFRKFLLVPCLLRSFHFVVVFAFISKRAFSWRCCLVLWIYVISLQGCQWDALFNFSSLCTHFFCVVFLCGLSFEGSPQRWLSWPVCCLAEGLEALCPWASLEGEPAGPFHWGSPPLLDLFLRLTRLFYRGIFPSAWRLRFWELSRGGELGVCHPLPKYRTLAFSWTCPPTHLFYFSSVTHPCFARVVGRQGCLSGIWVVSCFLPWLLIWEISDLQSRYKNSTVNAHIAFACIQQLMAFCHNCFLYLSCFFFRTLWECYCYHDILLLNTPESVF